NLSHVERTTHDLVNELGPALQSSPHQRVERSLGDDLGNLDFGILVTLPDGPPMPLGNISRTTGSIHVQWVYGMCLYAGSHPHLLGGANQHGNIPAAACGEEPALFGIGFCLVDKPHLLHRHTTGSQVVLELVIHVPALRRCTQIAEYDLQGPRGRVLFLRTW